MLIKCVRCKNEVFVNDEKSAYFRCLCGKPFYFDKTKGVIEVLKKEKALPIEALTITKDLILIDCECGASVYLVLNGGKGKTKCMACDRDYTIHYDLGSVKAFEAENEVKFLTKKITIERNKYEIRENI